MKKFLPDKAVKGEEKRLGDGYLLWHVPVLIVLLIYLPAAILGANVFRDKFSLEVLALLLIFTVSYYSLFPKFNDLLRKARMQGSPFSLGEWLNWYFLAWFAAGLYGVTILIASLTTEHTPLGAALLGGGSELDIARARAEFLANRQGPETLLRYSALILGKSVMPFIVLYLFYRESRWRYFGLFALLCALLVALEKSAAIYAFLPILLFFVIRKNWSILMLHTLALISCITFWTFLASGALAKDQKSIYKSSVSASEQVVEKSGWPVFSAGGTSEDWERMNLIVIFIKGSDNPMLKLINKAPRLSFMINRIVWIPYITAYDWLRFHDQVLKGRLTYGYQISGLGWALGKPKLQLEQMVYDFQLGAPKSGSGAANTIFLADAKLAFGWVGVIAYCVLFAFLSAVIFSSTNEVVKILSVTCFYTVALSPLTATFLSGGLLFILFMALFHHPPLHAPRKKGGPV
jgi:hypothetical protein